MRDHRDLTDPTQKVDITRLVREHHTKHPGSVRRSPKAARRAAAKRAAQSRKANWL